MPPANQFPVLSAFTNDTYSLVFFNTSNKGRKMRIDLFAHEIIKTAQTTFNSIPPEQLTPDTIINVIKIVDDLPVIYTTTIDDLVSKFAVKKIRLQFGVDITATDDITNLLLLPDPIFPVGPDEMLDISEIEILSMHYNSSFVDEYTINSVDKNIDLTSIGGAYEGFLTILYKYKLST